ncbi:dipeptide ABC transporter ATP-binding protein [soil metagenome]
MNDALINVRGLSKHFTVNGSGASGRTLKAVENVDFDIYRGETLGLIGESGCGKSTLGRVLGQLLPATSGTIQFEGRDIAKATTAERRKAREQIQIVFQDPYGSLNPRMNIRDIVAEPLRNYGIAKGAEADRMVLEMLDYCGLGRGAMGKFPREFSGGQRQRIGIARALILKPTFVVADEPVSALDVSIQAQVINLLKKLQAEFKVTYLFIGHDMAVVRHISDRVAVMYLGRMVEIAPSRRIYSAPQHPYTRVLLSSVPIPDPDLERKRIPISLQGEIPSPLSPPTGCAFHTRCPWAQHPVCSTEAPPLVELDGGSSVACHFAGRLAPLERKEVLMAA